jgi:hypothetical protein
MGPNQLTTAAAMRRFSGIRRRCAHRFYCGADRFRQSRTQTAPRPTLDIAESHTETVFAPPQPDLYFFRNAARFAHTHPRDRKQL